MPLYDFVCENGHEDEVLCKEKLDVVKCKVCGADSHRKQVNSVNAVFSGDSSSKNSIDTKIGRDADTRWNYYENKFKMKDKFMKKNSDAEVMPSGNGYVAVKDGQVTDKTHG